MEQMAFKTKQNVINYNESKRQKAREIQEGKRYIYFQFIFRKKKMLITFWIQTEKVISEQH